MRRRLRSLLEAARREGVGFECFLGVHVRCSHKGWDLTWRGR